MAFVDCFCLSFFIFLLTLFTFLLHSLKIGLRALIKSENEKALPNSASPVPTIELVRDPLAQAIGELFARSILRSEGVDRQVAGIIALIESC